ncbi:hypothetical protein D3C75_503270 [compost metagenome]
MATVKVLKGKVVVRDEDIDGRIVTLHFFRLPVKLKDIRIGMLWNSLDQEYGQHCSHEYDCCGCYCGGVADIKRLSKREICFKTSYSRNL